MVLVNFFLNRQLFTSLEPPPIKSELYSCISCIYMLTLFSSFLSNQIRHWSYINNKVYKLILSWWETKNNSEYKISVILHFHLVYKQKLTALFFFCTIGHTMRYFEWCLYMWAVSRRCRPVREWRMNFIAGSSCRRSERDGQATERHGNCFKLYKF